MEELTNQMERMDIQNPNAMRMELRYFVNMYLHGKYSVYSFPYFTKKKHDKKIVAEMLREELGDYDDSVVELLTNLYCNITQ